MVEDLADHGAIGEEGDDPALAVTAGAEEHVGLEHVLHQLGTEVARRPLTPLSRAPARPDVVAPRVGGGEDEAAVLVERESVGPEGGTRDMPAQPLEPLAVVREHPDPCVQRELLDIAVQRAWHEARTRVARATAQAFDRSAGLGPERKTALHRCRAPMRNERLIGPWQTRSVVLRTRAPAVAYQELENEAVEDGAEFEIVLIGRRRSCVEDRRLERTGARVDATQGQHVEVQIEDQRAAGALRDPD